VYFALGVASVVDSATTFVAAVVVADSATRGRGTPCIGAGLAGVALIFAAAWEAADELSVLTGLARRDDENIIGVTTITSAMSTSARRVRLSMQIETVAREPDHSRQAETDCTARCGALQASSRVWLRAVRVPRSRTRNSLDNNGTMEAAAETALPDIRERGVREAFAYDLTTRMADRW